MPLRYKILAFVGLIVFALWWCRGLIESLPRDVRAFRENELGVGRLGVGAIWAITALLLVAVVWIGADLVARML